MRPVRLLRAGVITCGIVLGSLPLMGGCGGVPETGEQVKDMPAPVSLEGMYKNQPKVKGVKAPPKYDRPGG